MTGDIISLFSVIFKKFNRKITHLKVCNFTKFVTNINLSNSKYACLVWEGGWDQKQFLLNIDLCKSSVLSFYFQ